MVSTFAQIVLWTCLALTAYTYLLYPACLWLLARFFETGRHARTPGG